MAVAPTPLQISIAKEHIVSLTKQKADLQARHDHQVASITNTHAENLKTLNAQHVTNMQILQAHLDGLHNDLSKLDPATVARVKVAGFDHPAKPKSITPFPGTSAGLNPKK